jgi:UDP-glucose 4-epimerase
MNNTKIVVTGAGGLIGSQTIKLLYTLGYPVIGVYRKELYEKPHWECVYTDLSANSLNGLIDNVSVVIHCAAAIPKNFNETDVIYQQNKNIDKNVLDFVTANNAGIIFISSTSLYGATGKLNFEEDIIIIKDKYSLGKFETELNILQLPVNPKIILRVNAPYGPQQKHTTVLKLFIEKAISGKDIFYYGNGCRQQDFTYVDDVANAVLQALQSSNVNGIYNISRGKPISMKELAKLIAGQIPGYKGKISSSGEPDPQENYKARFSIDKARLQLKWYPEISLKEGIKKWIKYADK